MNWDSINAFINALRFSNDMKLDIRQRALIFLLTLRHISVMWFSNFNSESIITPSNFSWELAAIEIPSMRTNLVKPYSAFHLDFEKLITNYEISKASRIIGSTFRIVEARIRVFCRPILATVETMESVTKGCVALHNYLIHFSPVSHFYTPWKRQKTKGFLTFPGGIEMWHWTKMG